MALKPLWKPSPASGLHTHVLNMLHFPSVDDHLVHAYISLGKEAAPQKNDVEPGRWALGLVLAPWVCRAWRQVGFLGLTNQKWKGRPCLDRTWAGGLSGHSQ